MKHMRKAFSLILAFVMIVSLSVPAFAASTDDAVVTVYVTTGMFTPGGIDASGNEVKQTYNGGNPGANLIDDYEAFPADGLSIGALLEDCRDVYGAPSTLSDDVNVLDAIIFSLAANGFSCSGGWDTYSQPNGGYISDVAGYPSTCNVSSVAINGVSYTKYSGMGWNIAFTQNGSYVVPALYGNNYVITDGMSIVFDYSYYELYYPAA